MAEGQLSEEERKDALYFLTVERDPERWTSWESKKELVKKEMPELWRAWKKYKRALEDLLEFQTS